MLPGAVTSLEAVVEAVGLREVPRESKKEPVWGKSGPRAAVLKLLNLGTSLHFKELLRTPRNSLYMGYVNISSTKIKTKNLKYLLVY